MFSLAIKPESFAKDEVMFFGLLAIFLLGAATGAGVVNEFPELYSHVTNSEQPVYPAAKEDE